MAISKAQALGIVFRIADTYSQELENRNLLFIWPLCRRWPGMCHPHMVVKSEEGAGKNGNPIRGGS